MVALANWATEAHQIKTHPHLPVVLEQVVQRSLFLLETLIPALFLITVKFLVGDVEPLANWVMEPSRISTHLL
jgi:hypothetical protein